MKLREILHILEEKSTSFRDKGAKFETLIKNWFLSTPLYCDNIQEIWLWEEFPYRNQFGGSDSGIDLVLLTQEDEFWAVQCKFYSEHNSIDKKDVDTFISTSAKVFEVDGSTRKFSNRIFVSTTSKWSTKASELIENQEIPVNRISLSILEDSGVDWSKIYAGQMGEAARREKKQIRDHQKIALENTHEHFKTAHRGKLIMACGTGKTYTSLKIAENETNGNGFILFLVPSIALLGQTLREWTSDVEEKLFPICICSDARITKKSSNTADNNMMSVVDLALPASTKVPNIVKQLEKIKDKKGLKVVFSTYHSISVIAEAQKKLNKKLSTPMEFDLIICDEAHRTTGVTLSDQDESNFVKVHDNEFVRAKKRLYMTATPRLYDDNSKSKAKEKDAYLCSMDDPIIYGEEIYRIGFGQAVTQGLLTDYKVLILTLNQKQITKEVQALITSDENELKLDDAGRLMGCINGLSKQVLDKEGIVKASDPDPMKKAVAFCQTIKASKGITYNLNEFSDVYTDSLKEEVQEKMVDVASKHIDGSMNALQREELLNWLKEDSDNEKECRVLTNARCLSEGVDVPTLDAVLFLSAKNSQVDVVQSVGRVMRRAPGKKYGYIIIPVVIPAGKKAEDALSDSKTYSVVWSVLNALRAHDDRFNAEVNKIDLNKRKPKNILIGTLDNTGRDRNYGDGREINEPQMALDYGMDVNKLQNAIYAKMVEKVGDRKYFERWAKDVARIAELQIDRIRILIKQDAKHKRAFNNFIKSLQSNINPDITAEQGIEMLSQHIITKPIFEALFEGYSFVRSNPISHSMQTILDLLLEGQIDKETEELESFYKDVRLKIGNIDNADGKQRIIVELYDKFFKTAFPKLVEKLGIVYTPVEVVDFVIHSVNDLLKKEFGRSLSDENVNILDPFTGTGTFISRLLQSRIIKKNDLERKYTHEIYANEIVLLAYYIAAVNIENVYHDLEKENSNNKDIGYKEFQGICLTDTFELSENDENIALPGIVEFKENAERVNKQKNAPLQVIIGNPPYSAGQKDKDDNAQNKKYPKLEKKMTDTYAKYTFDKKNINKLYDSYLKAFRWASDRLDSTGGIIGFVTNGQWLDSNTTSGFRKVIEKEFSSIYVFNLRGNQRTSGEQSRKEGGKIFGSGSRTPITITFLVKKADCKKGKAEIFYHDIGDYLSREDKLQIIKDFSSVKAIPWETLLPNQEGDWINLRNESFNDFIPLVSEKNDKHKQCFFEFQSLGIQTKGDEYCYNSSKQNIEQLRLLAQKLDTPTSHVFNIETFYRPFFKQNLYCDFSTSIYRKGKWMSMKTPAFENLYICISGKGSNKEFSVLMTNTISDYQIMQNTQCVPLYYAESTESKKLFSDDTNKRCAITDFIHNLVRSKYGVPRISKEEIFYYVYGILNNPDYQKKFETDLRKVVPRIPLVEEYSIFKIYSELGEKLAKLHVNYETLERPSNVTVIGEDTRNYHVEKMKFSKKQKDTIIFNENIKITNIPLEAYEYKLNGRSAIEWIIDRYKPSIAKKSGIVNDPNLWCDEHNDPKYILNLLLSIIALSLKTRELVGQLPKIEF